MSIKLKVTLWYTFLMIVVVGVVLSFMWLISGTIIATDTKKQAERVISTVSNGIKLDDDGIEINVSLIQNEVYTVIYREDKSLIAGVFQAQFNSDGIDFRDGKTQTITIDSIEFYVVDRLVQLSGEEGKLNVWIRGVVEADKAPNLMASLFSTALFTLPLLVVLAAIGGYLISRQAFKPIDRLMSAADKITEGKDLTQRIGLDSKDELGRLANTFDTMFGRLEAAFENEKQFTSDASHELRTPITVILAQTELAQKKTTTLQEHQEALNVIHNQATKMSALITRLLTLSRLDQSTSKIELIEGDLSELAMAVCDEQKESWNSTIQLTTDIDQHVMGWIDQTLIIRLMSNLIENAYQYTKEKGHILVTLKQTKQEIYFSVKDDGIGISKTDQEKIFKRFYQVESSRTANQRNSMGLGLALVAKIAQVHHGKIEVLSSLGIGTTFIFKMPKKNEHF